MAYSKIKNLVFVSLCAGLVLTGCAKRQYTEDELYDTINVVEDVVIDENSVPIFPKKAALTTDTAQHFALDLPKRCLVNWDNQSVVSVIPEEKIEIIRINTGDALPDLKVSDYSFKKMPVKEVLEKLLVDTDISIVEDQVALEKISGSISTSSLADAVELITKIGHVYYTYDGEFG